MQWGDALSQAKISAISCSQPCAFASGMEGHVDWQELWDGRGHPACIHVPWPWREAGLGERGQKWDQGLLGAVGEGCPHLETSRITLQGPLLWAILTPGAQPGPFPGSSQFPCLYERPIPGGKGEAWGQDLAGRGEPCGGLGRSGRGCGENAAGRAARSGTPLSSKMSHPPLRKVQC